MTFARSNHLRGWGAKHTIFPIACCMFLSSVGVGRAHAQTSADERPYTLSAEFGYAFTGGEFGKYVGSGPSGSVRLAYLVRGGTAWFAEAGLDQFGGREIVHHIVTGPDIRALRFSAGVEQELVPPDLEGYEALSLRVRLGAGVTSYKADDFRTVDGTQALAFSTTSPTAVGGLTLGFHVSESVTLIFDGGIHWSFVQEDQTTDLAVLAPTFVHSFKTTGTFPYGVGVSISF